MKRRQLTGKARREKLIKHDTNAGADPVGSVSAAGETMANGERGGRDEKKVVAD